VIPLPHRRLLSEEVFDLLCGELVDATIAAGTQLDVDELASRFGVSRTPVREALARLIRAGLVEASPNRYTRVSDLVDEDTVRSLRILHSTLHLCLPQGPITPELALELNYRVELAERQDDDGAALFEAVVRFLMRDTGSLLIEQVSDLTLPRTLRLLHAHPEHIVRAGGSPELRRLAAALATDPGIARLRLDGFFSALVTDVDGRLSR